MASTLEVSIFQKYDSGCCDYYVSNMLEGTYIYYFRIWIYFFWLLFHLNWNNIEETRNVKAESRDLKSVVCQTEIIEKTFGLNRDSNPGPLAPKARIIPLDHWATRYEWIVNLFNKAFVIVWNLFSLSVQRFFCLAHVEHNINKIKIWEHKIWIIFKHCFDIRVSCS